MARVTDSAADLGFGRAFTDHMAVAHYRNGAWDEVEILPFHGFVISPAAMVFHYGQAIFEGLKAFRQPDGTVALFRPDDNSARFDRSAIRMAMPPLPSGAFTSACADLVRTDLGAVPRGAGQSLYLRPLMFATEPGLGVRPAREYIFAVIASPVGAYFAGGLTPISVWAAPEFVRAAPGGTGAAKCAGNYGGGLAGKVEATSNGCDEVLWLDAAQHRYIEELGGMNVVFVERGGLVSPPPHDTILDGLTRQSLLELARWRGIRVEERPVTLDELDRFDEAFACGTAAVVVPIGTVRSGSHTWTIGDGTAGAITQALHAELVALQEGRGEDPFGWRAPVTQPVDSAERHAPRPDSLTA